MPPRHVYWTIIVDGKPTAFRAHSRDELLPTLRQLQSKHPDSVMKWFARGKLWESQEEERAAARNRGAREHRGRDWRPGGEHQDPRARFKVPRDVKRRRFAARNRRESVGDRDRPPGERPQEDSGPGSRPPWKREGRPRRDQQRDWRSDRRASRSEGNRDRPPSGRPRGEFRERKPGEQRRGAGGWRKPGGGKKGGGGAR
jgi:hypothetical protein